MTFKAYLKHRRKGLGLTQTQVGLNAGLDGSIICRMENPGDRRRIHTKQIIQKLAPVLQVDWKWLHVYNTLDENPDLVFATISNVDLRAIDRKLRTFPTYIQNQITTQFAQILTIWEQVCDTEHTLIQLANTIPQDRRKWFLDLCTRKAIAMQQEPSVEEHSAGGDEL